MTKSMTTALTYAMQQYYTIQGAGGNGALREDIGRKQLALHEKIMQYLSAQILQPQSMIKMRFPIGHSSNGEIWMGFARHVDRHSDPEQGTEPGDDRLVYRGIFIKPKMVKEGGESLDAIIMLGDGEWVSPEELVDYIQNRPAVARKIYFDE
ncbi:MAG: hypothetical protein Q7K45_05200 [Nanoarchaeota archaeon]|nr:hypothetical protein [Nanoarchaeota archaeon]